MGRATRWIINILGMKKEKDPKISDNSNSVKKRWSFGKSEKGNSGNVIRNQENISDAIWLRSYISETEKKHNIHAIAVAAATAAVADAAVAAAQSAVAVVRLTSHGRGTMFNGGRERWASVRIQTFFRGYLVRKALRALKGLVKLQALVRGYLVRKRAAYTLHCMQALFRAQTAVRSERARRSLTKDQSYRPPEFSTRRSNDGFGERRSEFHSKRHSTSHETSFNAYDDSPKIVEIDTFKPRSRSRRINPIAAMSDSGEDLPYPTHSSPLPRPVPPVPALINLPKPGYFQHFDWPFNGEECRFLTAQSTPRFLNSYNVCPITPSKSVCAYSGFYPGYMANTKSFKAKLRSHSAPKQRPEPLSKKRMSLHEIMGILFDQDLPTFYCIPSSILTKGGFVLPNHELSLTRRLTLISV